MCQTWRLEPKSSIYSHAHRQSHIYTFIFHSLLGIEKNHRSVRQFFCSDSASILTNGIVCCGVEFQRKLRSVISVLSVGEKRRVLFLKRQVLAWNFKRTPHLSKSHLAAASNQRRTRCLPHKYIRQPERALFSFHKFIMSSAAALYFIFVYSRNFLCTRRTHITSVLYVILLLWTLLNGIHIFSAAVSRE